MIDAETPWYVRYRYLVLAAVGALLYFVPLGLRTLWYPGEPDMAEVCRAMFVSGDWIAPRRNGEYWVDYPPLMYWAACLTSMPWGAVTEITLRLPSALACLVLGLGTCAAGSRWFGARTGFWSGFVLITFVEFVYEAINYRPDPLFTVTMSGGMLLYALGAGERPNWWLRAVGFACFGLAILAKGPLGLLLPGLVFALWHGSRREWARFFSLAPLALVALAVALPWHLACAEVMGSEQFWTDIYNQNFGRYGSGSKGHQRPWHHYVTNIWADFAIWSVLFPFALAGALRPEARRDRHVQLAFWWFFSMLAFFTLAETKRQLYLLPAYPAAALLIGHWVAGFGGPSERGGRAARFSLAVVAAVMTLTGVICLGAYLGFEALLAALEFDDELGLSVARPARPWIGLLGVVGLVGGAAMWRAWWRRDLRRALGLAAATHAAVLFVITSLVMPTFEPAKTYAPPCRWVRDRIGDSTHVGLVNPWSGIRNMGVFGFYTEALVAHLETEADIEVFFEEYPESVVIIHGRSLPDFRDSPTLDYDERLLLEFIGAATPYAVIGPPLDATGGGGTAGD